MSNDRWSGLSPSPIGAGLTGKCPRCGNASMFRGFIAVAPTCPSCGLDYSFADAGDGPAVFIMLIGGALVVGGALFTEIRWEPPMWVHAMIWPPFAIAVCLGLLRPLKGLLIALQYHNKAEQGRLEN
ncbi:DUF983 domain-containing protein [uncultured Alsobacter sp.]|uniref:DUF983 domain-containing protein n=1 Tax=uncultured Alsobacter sp. TaxID=1748258 RepID=UPI0025ECFDD9|nr:DUF983 domain-containing protein [uncultured Alsobacter sp.]